MNKLITIDNLHRYNENIQTVIDLKVQKLMTDTELKFFCIEPVTVDNLLSTNSTGDRAYAKQYTDELFGSFKFAANSDIDSLFATES